MLTSFKTLFIMILGGEGDILGGNVGHQSRKRLRNTAARWDMFKTRFGNTTYVVSTKWTHKTNCLHVNTFCIMFNHMVQHMIVISKTFNAFYCILRNKKYLIKLIIKIQCDVSPCEYVICICNTCASPDLHGPHARHPEDAENSPAAGECVICKALRYHRCLSSCLKQKWLKKLLKQQSYWSKLTWD